MIIYISTDKLDNDRVVEWSSSPMHEDDVELEISPDHEFFKNVPMKYLYKDGELVTDDGYLLKQSKITKRDELNRKCNETISGRFSHTVNDSTYYFSNDTEAQSNFEKADRAFEKGRMTEIGWTSYDVNGNVHRLVLTQETFEPLYLSHLYHIQQNIYRFRDVLMPQVESAQTVEELDTIIW